MAIYTSKGVKTQKLNRERLADPFKKIADYTEHRAQECTGDIKAFKVNKAGYFISGAIQPDDAGIYKRNNESLLHRDLIVLDYDEVPEDFIDIIKEQLNGVRLMVYPTISATIEKPRYRVIIAPSRSLVEREYKQVVDRLTDCIGLPYDHTSQTWSQLQGLPVITPQNKALERLIVDGEPYAVPDDLTPETPQKEPKNAIAVGGALSHKNAITVFKNYLDNEEENLQERDTNYLSLLMVLGKSVVTGEIEESTALECATLLAMGNGEWESGNVHHLENELKQANGNADYFKTDYSFIDKFESTQKGIKTYKVNGEPVRVVFNSKGLPYLTLPNIESMIRVIFDVGFNEFTKGIEILDNGKARPFLDDDRESVRMKIDKRFKVKASHQDIKTALTSASKLSSYHPVKNMIQSREWDGIERAEVVFIEHLGAEDTAYNREITRKWLLGAVSRIYQEGIKFDMTIVLQGKQGIGKSTIIEKLAQGFYTSIVGDIDKDTLMQIVQHWLIEVEEMDMLKRAEATRLKKLLSATMDDFRPPYGSTVVKHPRHSAFIGTANDSKYLKDKTGNRRFYPLLVGVQEVKTSIFTRDDAYILQVWAEVYRWYLSGESLLCSEETETAMNDLRGQALEYDFTEEQITQYLEVPMPVEWWKLDDWDLQNYVNDMMARGESEEFKELKKVKRSDVTTAEILKELYNMDIKPDFRGNSTARNVANVMGNLSNWQNSNKVKRGGQYRLGYKRIDDS